MRTREGLEVARAAGKLRGRKPKLSVSQERHLVQLHRAGEKNPAEFAELFGVGRSTVYRALERGRLIAEAASPPESANAPAALSIR
jgi:DNA invertase Pin-like site-specific DNA recombinase